MSWLNNTTVTLGIRTCAEDPPFVAGGGETGYDESLATIKGRFSYLLVKEEILRNLFGGELLRQQLPQHKRQNPAVPIIIDLDRCIDPKLHGH
jgi:hypothetical protein